MSQDLNFPFIQYLEGSYFGDSEILRRDSRHNARRTSTAIASEVCQLFLLLKDNLMKLRKTFPLAIQDMQNLAAKRSQKHQNLFKKLSKKVNFIEQQRQKDLKSTSALVKQSARGSELREYFQSHLIQLNEQERVSQSEKQLDKLVVVKDKN